MTANMLSSKKSSKPTKKREIQPKKRVSAPLFEEVNVPEGEIIEITKDMIIGDVVLAFPEVMKPLQDVGIHCVGCYASTYDTIEEGALKHNMNPDKLCDTINQAIRKKHTK